MATLGEYDVYAELGRGGMAAVYLAVDLTLDRKVAIKVLLPELLTGAGMSERFRREAKTAGALSHPHIIPIHAVRESEGLLYFVMKFVEGRGLDSIIKELGTLPIAMVETVVTQVAGALAHAHRKNVIHRDIKPANIMIDDEGWAVVADFGIAKVQEASSLTSTGAAVGTPYYMSPEQCSAAPVTGAADQYSLGITAYEMLTGRTPFRGTTVMEVISAHFFEAPAPIRATRPDCPASLEQTVLRMLGKDAATRFASLEDVVTAIKAPPLAHDDPIRTQMITLAMTGVRNQPRISVPVSPTPLTRHTRTAARKRSGGEALAPTLDELPVHRFRNRALAASFVGVALLAGGTFYLSRERVVGSPTLRAADSVGSPSSLPAARDAASGASAEGRSQPGANGPAVIAPIISLPGPTAPPATATPSKALPDPRAATRRDSIARAARKAKDDSAKVIAGMRDSLSKLTIRTRAAESTATAKLPEAVAPPIKSPAVPPAVVVVDTGTVVLGSRIARAYYVDGAARGVMRGLQRLTLKTGVRRLAINAEGCTAWDTTITVRPAQNDVIGYRDPKCPQEK